MRFHQLLDRPLQVPQHFDFGSQLAGRIGGCAHVVPSWQVSLQAEDQPPKIAGLVRRMPISEGPVLAGEIRGYPVRSASPSGTSSGARCSPLAERYAATPEPPTGPPNEGHRSRTPRHAPRYSPPAPRTPPEAGGRGPGAAPAA